MSHDNDSAASSVLLSFILGGLTGAALALLYAPRSGRETREMLGERIREGEQRARKMRDRAALRSRELYDDAVGFVEKGREGLESRKERLAAAVDAGRQAYRDEKDKG